MEERWRLRIYYNMGAMDFNKKAKNSRKSGVILVE